MRSNAVADQPAQDQVITKAALSAARRLGVSNGVLARILGLSEASVSRMGHGTYLLKPGDKPFELAVLFVRLFRSLDAIVGGDEEVAKAWLRADNSGLRGRPLALIQTVAGLTDVIAYLDARRAVV